MALGPEMVQSMVTASFGAPLSRAFLKSYVSVVAERVKRISAAQNFELDFDSDGFQIALALLVTKVETCKTGLDQFLTSFGDVDHVTWASKYKAVLMTQQLKKINLFESFPELGGAESRPEIDRTFRMVANLIRDPVLYGFMVLLAVTIPANSGGESKPLAELNSRYHMLLQRRIFAQAATKPGQGLNDPNEVLGKIYHSFASLKKMSAFLRPLLN